jgi:hypothetical protein
MKGTKMAEDVKLPALTPQGDGWNDAEHDDRVIQGTLLKCVDGKWSAGGEPAPEKLMAVSTITVMQLWKGKKPVQTLIKQPGQPWPKLDDLNAEIPEGEWEVGLDGEPRPPWQKQFIIYLLEPESAATFTYANGTAGARQAVSDLKNSIKWQRTIRGDHVVPLVELSSKPMPTKFGTKQRPHFQIVEWRNLDVGFMQDAPAVLPSDMGDAIPFNG